MKTNNFFRHLTGIALLMILLNNSCQQEQFTSDPAKLPAFSSDTISFDTVFTTLGSATLFIKIYNPHEEFLRITSIKLAGGQQSHFRMNLDGQPGTEFKNIEIRPKDSLYIFCEVTINPVDPLEVSPFIIQDSIVFLTNSVSQRVLLVARGQNANYFPDKSNKAQVSLLDLQGGTLRLDDPKPYIFYGIVVVDNGTLEIDEGTNLHFFGGITAAKDAEGNRFFYNDGRLIIGSNARILVKGTLEKPVVFRGVRLESFYQNIPGQWSGLFIDKYSTGNEIRFAEIRNNLVGLYLDSLAECLVDKCKFSFNSYQGISCYAAQLRLYNSLFHNQGQQSLLIQNGGIYDVVYSTFANLGNTESAVQLSNNYCTNAPFCSVFNKHPLKAGFTNCLITGTAGDEFWMRKDADENIGFEVSLDHCLLRVNELIRKDYFPDFKTKYGMNCYYKNDLDSLFKNISTDDFSLDSLSFADKKAIPLGMHPTDLKNVARDLQFPDLGCYELK
ncbi:MAG TPA: hypothetical protein PK209_11780 [Saprospiraceae bacterium]|nr:hypothetical protein [Saprospiraceae bacterium]